MKKEAAICSESKEEMAHALSGDSIVPLGKIGGIW